MACVNKKERSILEITSKLLQFTNIGLTELKPTFPDVSQHLTMSHLYVFVCMCVYVPVCERDRKEGIKERKKEEGKKRER